MQSLDLLARRLLAEAESRFPLGYSPRLEWRAYRTTAGRAYPAQKLITLSRELMTDEARLRETLLHEYAHLLAVARDGRRGHGHGPSWQRAMRDLGLEPQVRHSFPCRRNQPRQVVTYRCERCGADLKRLRRLPRRRKYIHVGCGGALRFHEAERAVTGSASE